MRPLKKKKSSISQTAAETEHFAAKFAKTLKPGDILLLIGELGTGKTTFVRGLAKGLKISPKINIHSPSFTIINEYPGKIPLFHIDLYRLNEKQEIENLGIEDYLNQKGIIAIEWADHAMEFWPEESIKIEFERVSEKKRRIKIPLLRLRGGLGAL